MISKQTVTTSLGDTAEKGSINILNLYMEQVFKIWEILREICQSTLDEFFWRKLWLKGDSKNKKE
jgi:hypothetical protein